MAASDHTLLGELNEKYVRAVGEGDAAWLDANISPDFLNSNPDGSLAERADFMARIEKLSVPSLKCEDVRIRILGDTALIHGRTTYIKPDGQPGQGRYTDIWMKQPANSRWLCVAAHVTRG